MSLHRKTNVILNLIEDMKRKQNQSTLFECFRKPAPKATAASDDTSAAADDTIVTETPENEADAIVKLPGK